MRLHDINLLIYAFRKDTEHHALARSFLEEATTAPTAFAITGHTLSGFVRLVTDRRIFRTDPTPIAEALRFTRALLASPNALFLSPGSRHWQIVDALCERTDCTGALVSDACLAAIAVENGCELVTFDRDYARFPGLTWRHPLEANPQTNPGSVTPLPAP